MSAPDIRMSGARVYLYNEQLETGVILKANADGSYVAYPLMGEEGDFIDIYYGRSDAMKSATICRVLGVDSRPCP